MSITAWLDFETCSADIAGVDFRRHSPEWIECALSLDGIQQNRLAMQRQWCLFGADRYYNGE